MIVYGVKFCTNETLSNDSEDQIQGNSTKPGKLGINNHSNKQPLRPRNDYT